MITALTEGTMIPNVFAILLFGAALLVAIRAIYAYLQVRNPRLFILGVSMGILSLTAIADFASSNITSVTLNTDWFLYIGQATSFLFIFLSLLTNDNAYFQKLMRAQVFLAALLIGTLLLSPTLPPFTNLAIKATLSGSRSLICFGIFYFYVTTFMRKQTRFSLLMSVAFVLLAFGYLMIVQQYFVNTGVLFDNEGDLIRTIGLIALLIAVFRG